MISSFSLAILLASVTTTLVRADVFPSTPNTANAGTTCTINWTGDSNSTSNWSNMAIELMTGDNFNMVFLTTVATGQDGTKDGSFSWTCPQVNPFSAIYFYQFVSPLETSNPQWTTRFAIASSSGATTAPPNSTQPDGEKIPWGTGALVDATASAPPSFASGITSGSVPADSTTATTSSKSTSSSGTASGTASGTSGATTSTPAPPSATIVGGNTSGAAGNKVTSTITASPTSGASNSTTSSNSNSGLGLAVDGTVWTSAFGVISSAMVLSLFL
ncbi:hypothetical protein BDP27DRAFT_1224314 [Rhodocollybia butyracea]|uniref:Yeast cell wall synthesis Kre9/Knh1-like N-terminal domain-containing protein n=1 Tax=Rhodocollybia butyracea TaxID=206335 RepID=A0A9P5PUM7_9AGAR|nr:hypothetical protein BDP27DRAFT_1224314 [Rhodocollybia butyracea]